MILNEEQQKDLEVAKTALVEDVESWIRELAPNGWEDTGIVSDVWIATRSEPVDLVWKLRRYPGRTRTVHGDLLFDFRVVFTPDWDFVGYSVRTYQGKVQYSSSFPGGLLTGWPEAKTVFTHDETVRRIARLYGKKPVYTGDITIPEQEAW